MARKLVKWVFMGKIRKLFFLGFMLCGCSNDSVLIPSATEIYDKPLEEGGKEMMITVDILKCTVKKDTVYQMFRYLYLDCHDFYGWVINDPRLTIIKSD